MYKIKQQPEDFRVKEISKIEIKKEKGPYLYFKLAKKGRNTLDVIKQIAYILQIKEKNIGFAGSKDKNAVTEQVCSIKAMVKKRLSKVKINNAKLTFVGYGNAPISLGDLEGNYFEIIVRNLKEEKLETISLVENYFDEQRFSQNNVQIGKHLIKKEFSQAVRLIDKQLCREHLKIHKNDFIGALRQLPIRLLRLYVNAYQSYLWNETLVQYLREKGKVIKEISYQEGKLVFVSNLQNFSHLEIPLVGFNEIAGNRSLKRIIKDLMDRESIDNSNFIIKQIPPLTLEGERRKAVVEIYNLTLGKKIIDELNKNKKKVKVTFSLPKGSYATMVIKRIT